MIWVRKPRFTFLRYSLDLAYRVEERLPFSGSFEVMESLEHIKLGEAWRHLRFHHSQTLAEFGCRAAPFISTTEHGRHSTPGWRRQSPPIFLGESSPINRQRDKSPTALLARREMQSWRLIQLEPSSLRRPDDFMTPGMRPDGSHLPATLYSLAHYGNPGDSDDYDTWVYEQIALRLSDLIDDVYEVSVDRDEKNSFDPASAGQERHDLSRPFFV